VDDTLVASGAPPDHPLWTALRRVGALPGEAVDAIVALRAEPLSGSAAGLHALAEEYTREAAQTADAQGWTGTAAQAYGARRRDLADHLGAAAGRLTDTGRYLAEVAAWTGTARREVAHALAEVLGSAEA